MAGNDAQVQFQQNGGTRKWRYQGVSFDGQRKEKGVVEAQTRDQAIERIKKLGLYPTDLTDTAAGTGLNTEINIKAFEKYPSKKDFAVTARQLATMVAAGVSLIRALNIVTEQIENVKLRKAVQACVAQVEGGSSFSEAMSADPDSLFPPIMVNMVRAGGQIKSAMAYPVVVLGIALILVMVMLLTIVPMFASMYDSMNAQLPFVTQILVDLGKVMPYVLPMLIVAVVALAMFWKRNRNKDIIRTWWDPFTLKAPVFGKLDTNVALIKSGRDADGLRVNLPTENVVIRNWARFCNNFSSMLASGVPILQALDIVGSTSGNYVIDSSSKRVGRLVERGYRLADSMSTEKIFPNMLVQMVSIGEDSGAIDKMLSSAGRAYDEEAQSMAKQLTSLLEPLMILFLGVVVGFMVVALYMPMFSMFDAINGQA